jgi:predicted TIM-barrel fold metal-dependent hydrolase
MPAISALKSIIPISQIMFGSDFPLVPLPATAGGLERLQLTAEELRSIKRENALRLLPRHGR